MSASPPAKPIASWRLQKKPDQAAVFTIPSTESFVDALATGLKADASGEPLSLARMTVLMPTRRACRALRQAFLRQGAGAPVLLPRLIPLNDLDDEEALLTGFAAPSVPGADIPPPIDALRRQLLLAKMILQRDGVTHDQAVALAAELGRLIDRMQTENVSFERLKDLVPDDYAEHWQQTLKFLDIVTENWPKILAEQGCIDPVDHRNHVFAAQAKAWRAMAGQLSGPIVAAGSTGSIPATADLLDTIARLPLGCVVLPGLDQPLDDASWEDIDECHPQYGLKHLLKRLEVGRDAVSLWPGCPEVRNHPRLRLVSEFMRPAATTDRWTGLRLPTNALSGIDRILAPTPREEAGAIAMAMREALEAPDKTCALVTPDRDLARRVAGELERWQINVDDSAGSELEATPVGAFLRLIAGMVASDFAPLALLSVCKHPLAAAGIDPVVFRDITRLAERALLRGPRPAPGLDVLRELIGELEDHRDEVMGWFKALERCCIQLAQAMSSPTASVAHLLDVHMRCAEVLASTHDTAGPLRLWAGEDGESAATFVAELALACDALPVIAPRAYPALFGALLKGRVVRPRFGKHPRLSILGPLEARLQRFDTIILAGLNEGTWPADPAPDPWMSRPMRERCGLPSPERRIGLAAHDIGEAMCGPRVILSRAAKVEGTPTVPSRWLMRLDQVIAAAALTLPTNAVPWLEFAHAITRPASVKSWPAPAPCPPVAARPRRLSVTQVETWMRDPYAIYARHILRLDALDPIDADVSAADYGTLVHRALQEFILQTKRGEPDEQRLLAIGERLFAAATARPAIHAFWWPRFQRIARWFVNHENLRRGQIKDSFVEKKGGLMLRGPAGPFEIVAKADRIDLKTDGYASIIDYKTGAPPSTREVLAGFAPQLPLEAAMVLEHGFPDISAVSVGELAFWHLHGRDDGATEAIVKADATTIAQEARDGAERLIAAYDRPDTPYQARPYPAFAPRYSDYEHLARVKEWSSVEDNSA